MTDRKLISDDYRRAQERLHENPDYGVESVKFAPVIAQIVKSAKIAELLDYGAGKGRLGEELKKLNACPAKLRHYDPGVARWSVRPEPAEMVACIDVLEHIEPEYLDNVLDDLKRVIRRIGFFTVATGPAMKTLPDGRNAHLIQERANWWLTKFLARFELQRFERVPGGFLVAVGPLRNAPDDD